MKYIIEADDRSELVQVISVMPNGTVYTNERSIDELEKLNSDYINEHYGSLQDDAYQRGFDDAHKISGEEYQRGLEDTWEAARKIGHASQMKLKEMGFDFTDKDWCYNPSWYVVMNYTASEAIAKLKAYEEKQKADDKIKVRDEVMVHGFRGVVTHIRGNIYTVMMYDGSCGEWERNDLKKTGKQHDIDKILEAMKA